LALFTRKDVVSTEQIFEGSIIDLRVDRLLLADGKSSVRETVEHNGGVVIACQPSKDEIILIKQYRFSVDRELLELPAGRIEKGEPPLPAAQRELTEETGYKAKKWAEMAKMYSAPGFCNEVLHFFHATDVEMVGANLDEDEEIDVLVLPLRKAYEMVLGSDICDAKTLAALGILLKQSP
jgi:ADP-ribose pyrophosphatase